MVSENCGVLNCRPLTGMSLTGARPGMREKVRPPLIKYLELDVSGCQVISRELFEKRCIQSLGLPRETTSASSNEIPRYQRPLRIGPEIDENLPYCSSSGVSNRS